MQCFVVRTITSASRQCPEKSSPGLNAVANTKAGSLAKSVKMWRKKGVVVEVKQWSASVSCRLRSTVGHISNTSVGSYHSAGHHPACFLRILLQHVCRMKTAMIVIGQKIAPSWHREKTSLTAVYHAVPQSSVPLLRHCL